ncbi:MAG TPA: hypothetical protein VJV79_28010 [Polyangiaceae bacterium]|nr:hypothetical protein [Polyangiaceae bacterium]
MSTARWPVLASLAFGICQASLSACGSGDSRPASLVNAGGRSASSGGAAGRGGNSGDAGQANEDAGNGGSSDEAGAAGEGNVAAAPLAIFPRQLQVDVGCGANTDAAELVIHNGGLLPLTISSATTSAGYAVKGQMPLQIASLASATLQVTPPTPKASASIGDKSSGTLTFVTNEADSPTREVLLDTTLFGGKFAFTDGDGQPLLAALPLTYLSSDSCPDDATYRVHNTGNLAFKLFGPLFPTHLAGSSTGAAGQNVAPDSYIEFKVGGHSSSDGACSGNGELIFTVEGPFCGAVPKLSVSWPANGAASGCACTANSQ